MGSLGQLVFVDGISVLSHEELVCGQLPALSTHKQNKELELSFLVNCFSLGSLLALAHSQFPQSIECVVFFPQAVSAQQSDPPSPG
jgi:hypothetical protein